MITINRLLSFLSNALPSFTKRYKWPAKTKHIIRTPDFIKISHQAITNVKCDNAKLAKKRKPINQPKKDAPTSPQKGGEKPAEIEYKPLPTRHGYYKDNQKKVKMNLNQTKKHSQAEE